MICKLPCVIKGARSDIDNNPPFIHSVTQAVNTSLYACKVSFSRTQKRKFVRLEFLLFRDSVKICASLFVLYDKYICTVQVCKSNKDFQLNQHTVVRTSNESDWQVRLLSSKCLLQLLESQSLSSSGHSFV